jgi:dolichol-phosphate mannosyltransferase
MLKKILIGLKSVVRDMPDLPERLRQPIAPPLALLSVVIPARDEAGCIASTVEHLHLELRLHGVPHEIIVVDDGSNDQTWSILEELRERISELNPVHNSGEHGFGRAVICGLERMTGDAVVIMMADESDDCRDVVRYWQKLNEGFDCVFGSRFLKGGGVIDYPWVRLQVNRLANNFLRLLFDIPLNDTTNAFKAYRRTVIEGCQPLIAPHFNLTVEIPLKAIVRGYSWTVIPITWRNRRSGEAKLKIKEMGSRYLFICLYVWLEKYFSRGDYLRRVRLEQRDGDASLLLTDEDVHCTGATTEKEAKKGQPFAGADKSS